MVLESVKRQYPYPLFDAAAPQARPAEAEYPTTTIDSRMERVTRSGGTSHTVAAGANVKAVQPCSATPAPP